MMRLIIIVAILREAVNTKEHLELKNVDCTWQRYMIKLSN
jgi:hypothetical protein